MCSSPLPLHLRGAGGTELPPLAGERDQHPQKDRPRSTQQRKEEREQPQGKPARGNGSSLAAAAGAAGAAAQPGESPRRHQRHGSRGKDKGEAGDKDKQQLQQQKRQGGHSVAALTALGSVALYATARGGIALFHHARRHFLTHLLHDLSAALNALGATWWLDFGSLLGIYRDGELILHDNDIDLAVWQPDWDELLTALRGQLPQYSMRLVVPSDDPTTRFIRVYCPLGMADVFGAHAAGEGRVLVDCGHGSCTEIDHAAVLPTAVMTWRGSKISVPGDVPLALEQRYGADWRVPRYMDKGADVVEGQKLYARIFRALGSFGIRI